MKQKLLHGISKLFTDSWVQSQQDNKLVGFSRNAEYCLHESYAYKVGICLGGLILSFGIFMLTSSVWEGVMPSIAGIALLIGVIKALPQGTTAKALVSEWKPLRKKLLKQGVISQTVKLFKRDHPNFEFIPPDHVREILVRSIDELMGSHSARLIDAQREGFPEKEKKIWEKMTSLKDLTGELGLEMNFDQYFQRSF